MQEFKGTPGPWFAEYSRENDAYEIAPMGRNGITMAWDKEICITADNNVENAQLISAAPDLLKVAISIVSGWERKAGISYQDIIDARAAIAKALGN